MLLWSGALISVCPTVRTALVSPSNWWFLGSYRRLRDKLLLRHSFTFIAALGRRLRRHSATVAKSPL